MRDSLPSPTSADSPNLRAPPSRRLPMDCDRWLQSLLERSHDMILALDAHGGIRFRKPCGEPARRAEVRRQFRDQRVSMTCIRRI